MTIKRMWIFPVLLAVLAVISLSGCESVIAKEMIVTNTSSDVTIDGVMLREYVGSRGKIFDDMMETGETIEPGESKSFFIAPSTSSFGAELTIDHDDDYSYFLFTYDYRVNGKNQPVTVSFDGTDFTVSGSNAEEIPT